MNKGKAPKGNFISEWFGQRIYPTVKLDLDALSEKKLERLPVLDIDQA